MSLKHICPYLGCHELIPVSERYCQKHMALINARQAEYDSSVRHKRDAKLTAFYHSQQWVKLQRVIIAKYHGLDLWAYFVDHEIVKAEMVHHIKPLREYWSDRLSIGNLIPLSNANHGMIEQLYKTSKREETQRKLLGLIERWEEEFG
ncbi:HNH endonuclease [Caproiciproducens galactitolivorans]|uniref:HNH endonuclease n=1 Tax=Caproiciproducens galactitolivorans TaxID=642589 RepID=A0A4Z0Y693_9FIRM|nr:HNH endonuclease [Caproiciproducens galactitolivorans]QEY34627.1 HNH endonuclease [Caproiciproducens galactitolivorans]TGJ75408.1 hypothetical protein CAGA_24320 [Caproiciproducens galactitolivorans]